MKNISIKTSAIILSFLFVVFPAFVLAQNTTIQNPLKGGTDIAGFVSTLLTQVVRIGGVVAIFMFIWSGFMFVKAQGNPTALQTAKTIFINTCIGVAVLLGAQLIASIIVNTIKSLK